jgi:signal-transduction protein with cAMP-binding, CBS, and nucleotidyltransferase domain
MAHSEEIARALIPVEDVMRSPPVTTRPTRRVRDVVRAMVEYNVGSVIVVSDDERIRGIVTERDILERVVVKGKTAEATEVTDVMSSPVLTIDHKASLRNALKLMRDNNVRRLAVMKAGTLEGQVTERRILDALIFISQLD